MARRRYRDPGAVRARRSFQATFVLVTVVHVLVVGALIFLSRKVEAQNPLGDVVWLDAAAFTTTVPEVLEEPEPTPESDPGAHSGGRPPNRRHEPTSRTHP